MTVELCIYSEIAKLLYFNVNEQSQIHIQLILIIQYRKIKQSKVKHNITQHQNYIQIKEICHYLYQNKVLFILISIQQIFNQAQDITQHNKYIYKQINICISMGCLNSKKQSNLYDKPTSNQSQTQSQKHFLAIKKQYDPQSEQLRQFEQLLQIQSLNIQFITNFSGMPEHPCFKQIQKDISRTFPNQEHFSQLQHLQEFRLVLKNYAINFPKIGYTQGLNFIAGYLLLHKMKVQPAFKCFLQISKHPQLMCVGLYQDHFPLCYLYCKLFWKILQQLQPKVQKRIKAIGISDEVWIFQWFLTFFIYSFPLQYIGHFFIFIFKHKKFAMARLAVSIIVNLKKQLKKIKDDDYFQFSQCLDTLKHYDQCLRKLNLTDVINYAQNKVTQELVEKHLKKISQQKTIDNFYVRYFSASQPQQKQMYSKFLYELDQNKQELSKSKNSQSMQNSYRRPRQSVQIIDQILYQSLKLTKDRRCKSNLDSFINQNAVFKFSQNKHDLVPMWKSQANMNSFEQNIMSRNEKNVQKQQYRGSHQENNQQLNQNQLDQKNFYKKKSISRESIVMKYTTQEDVAGQQQQKQKQKQKTDTETGINNKNKNNTLNEQHKKQSHLKPKQYCSIVQKFNIQDGDGDDDAK